jgi:hypothetical protein
MAISPRPWPHHGWLGFGLGTRGQRFSMVVNDGVVEQLHVEAPGDFKVSSAEYMLENLWSFPALPRAGRVADR